MHLTSYNYTVSYFNSKLELEVPSSSIFSVVLRALPPPPIKIRTDGAAQLECSYLIMRIILERQVRNISENGSLNIII